MYKENNRIIRYALVMQSFRVVFHEISHASFAFSQYKREPCIRLARLKQLN